jgi:ribosome-binding protein aMBF1 (putative translation factor)
MGYEHAHHCRLPPQDTVRVLSRKQTATALGPAKDQSNHRHSHVVPRRARQRDRVDRKGEITMRPKPQRLAEKLLTIRQRLGLSQSQLASQLRFKPHYTRVSEFETGRRTPPLLMLLDYARVARCHIDDLVDDEREVQLIDNRR